MFLTSFRITSHNRLLHIIADDVVVPGLQKWPISSIVLKVRFVEVLEFGTITVAVSLLGDNNVGVR